jgi:hypothetical protein
VTPPVVGMPPVLNTPPLPGAPPVLATLSVVPPALTVLRVFLVPPVPVFALVRKSPPVPPVLERPPSAGVPPICATPDTAPVEREPPTTWAHVSLRLEREPQAVDKRPEAMKCAVSSCRIASEKPSFARAHRARGSVLQVLLT